jgi:mannose-6-phosphate isomerase-like protein (cupin superfamily)
LDAPDEKRSFENGKIDVVTVGGLTMGRMTLQPGWKWSKSVKPIVKTNSCQTHHVGSIISGRLKTVLDDGSEAEFGPGDAYDIPPGHDGWVVGDNPVIAFELLSAAQYGKK